jgi:uncharacterized protein (TIGR03000 family)
MYSMVLMAALTTGIDMPDRGGRGGCHGCYGGCWGGYGGCSGMGWGGCWGGGYGGCRGGGWGGCYGMSYGGCYGMGYGGCYGMSSGRGWGGGYGGYVMGGYSPMMSGYAYSPMMSASGMGTPVMNGYAYSPMMSAGGMGTPMMPAGGVSQSFYSSINSGNEATLVIHVPEAASLSIDGQPTQQSSGTRIFTSPPLEQGKTYVYKVTAEMNRDGHTVRDTKSVEVRPGQRAEVTMNFGNSSRGREERSEPNEDESPRRPTTPRTSPILPPDR